MNTQVKYEVIGHRWSEEVKAIVPYVAGTFNDFANAHLFKIAYSVQYTTADVEIVTRHEIKLTKKDG